jgi:hypothetical protein
MQRHSVSFFYHMNHLIHWLGIDRVAWSRETTVMIGLVKSGQTKTSILTSSVSGGVGKESRGRKSFSERLLFRQFGQL